MNQKDIMIIMLSLLMLIAIGMSTYIVYGNMYPQSRFVEPYTGPEMAKLKKLMQKHGVSSAECEGSDCYFIRDGERCALK